MKNLKKFMLLFVAVIMIISALPILALADTVDVTLRIEGDTANLFYGVIKLEKGESVPKASDIIDKAVADTEGLTVNYQESGYIDSVNGIKAGKYHGFDGWLYTVNGESSMTSVKETEVKTGDVIVLFYADMSVQYPELDTAKLLSDGIITVTSNDAQYDEQWNFAGYKSNPVVGAKLKLDDKEYTTDDKGVVTIDKAQLTAGNHAVQLEKKAENGAPAILRLAPDAVITVSSVNVTLRIEGDTANLFYGKVSVTKLGSVTASDIIDKAVADTEGLTVNYQESGYIDSVNGIKAGKYQGYDGWMYTVNGESPYDSVKDLAVKNDDVIVLFYADMSVQYPKLDTAKLESDGIITVTSDDAQYDEQWNFTGYKSNPVVGAKLSFDGKEYTTDENGVVTIDKAQLTAGNHAVQLEKKAENGAPAILRLAPDTVVTISAQPEETTQPPMGDSGVMNYVVIAVIAVAFICLMSAKLAGTKRKNEIN